MVKEGNSYSRGPEFESRYSTYTRYRDIFQKFVYKILYLFNVPENLLGLLFGLFQHQVTLIISEPH